MIGTSWLWNYDESLATAFYEIVAIIIELSLITFILTKYLGISLLKEKRFYLFLITTTLGLGIKALAGSTTTLEIENIVLAVTIIIFILSYSYFHSRFKISNKLKINIDDLVLLSFGFTGLIYLISYIIASNSKLFYLSQSFLLITQAVFWLICGVIYLLKENRFNWQNIFKNS